MRFDTRSSLRRAAVRSWMHRHGDLAPGGRRRASADDSAAASPSTDTVPQRSVGVLRPGDVLKIAVFRDKELTGDYPIDARGYVQIPGLGVIKAAGLEPTDVTDRLRARAHRARIRAAGDFGAADDSRVRARRGSVAERLSRSIPARACCNCSPWQADRPIARGFRTLESFATVVPSAWTWRADCKGSAAGRVVLYSNDVVVVGRKKGFTSENLGLTLTAASLVLAVLNIAFLVRKVRAPVSRTPVANGDEGPVGR